MDAYIVIMQSAMLAAQVLCETTIPVTDNFQNRIALEVLKVSPVNTVVSPMALKLPLCKLTAVATGETKTELMSALGISRESQTNCYDKYRKQLLISEFSELTMHNRMYFNDSLEVSPGFLNQSLGQFGVRIGKLAFRYPKASAKQINRWAAAETLYRVSSLIDDDDVDNTTSMVIVNGVHFKGNWESPFDIRYTKNKFFREESTKPVSIPMMVKLSNFDYVDDVNLNVKVLNLKFSSMGSSITFVMPTKKNGLPALLETLSNEPTAMKTLKNKLKDTFLKIFVPRIKIKTYVDWTDFLRLIGINKILEVNNKGLGGILKENSTSDVPVHLSLAKQKVFFEIDEMGLTRTLPFRNPERADMEMFHLGEDAEELTLDQPFYFVVTLRSSGIDHELFNGVYRRPEQV